VYILRDDFQREVSVDDVKIDFDSVRFMFFNVGDIEKWPHYLSFDNAENAGYYQHLKGSYAHKGQDYVVYRSITKSDILTSLSFSNDGSFTIKGINWKDGKSVVFRNIKNIALSNIVTQLNSSRFINVDPLLDQYFNVFGFEPGQNPRRSTYIFKKGMFEQGTTLKMNELIDFTEIQKKQDRKIACHNILGSKILSDFFTRDQLKGKVKGNRHLAYFIRRLLITNNKTIINVMEKVDVHSEDWITEQNKKLLKKFNAHSENKGSKKADTWTDLADTPTSGLGDLYKLLAHSIGTAYNYMGVFMKLPQENEEYEKVRELLEKTLNDAYINLRSIEIESNHNSLPGEAKTNLLFDKVNIPRDYLKKNLLVEFSPQNVFLIGQSI
ncbi:MAG: hypothetical protein KAI72_02275, partial [Candidatus Pacebacteria bacterium]|nr:hypothetical protein [Candidatus Paceibacterota bacterium]